MNKECIFPSNQSVYFRTDASTAIGSGHVMRCLTLADQLKDQNCSCTFLCADLPGHMMEYIQQKGYVVKPLTEADSVTETLNLLKESQPDWLVVDHYGIDIHQEKLWRPFAGKILIIDDLANRSHDCDVLLDQNYLVGYEHRYDKLVPKRCVKLLGPGYALLRPEFYAEKESYQIRSGEIHKVLVFFSGSDPTGETLKFLAALPDLVGLGLSVDVVVGISNPARDQIESICHIWPNVTFHCQIDYMAQLMRQADLAIGAGGTTIWERCILGLPSVVTVVAANQVAVVEAVAEYGAVLSLGWHSHVVPKEYAAVLHRLVKDSVQVRQISMQAEKLMILSQRSCGN